MIYFQLSSSGVIDQAFKGALNPVPSWVTETFDDADTNALSAFDDYRQYPSSPHYTYDASTKAWTYTAPSSAEQLADAQKARMSYLAQSFEQAINAGFPSSADGTARTYAIDSNAMAKWTGILANINSGKLTSNIIVKDVTGTKVNLTTAQFETFSMDGFTYFNNQEQNLWTKETDVENATTVTDVNAVIW